MDWGSRGPLVPGVAPGWCPDGVSVRPGQVPLLRPGLRMSPVTCLSSDTAQSRPLSLVPASPLPGRAQCDGGSPWQEPVQGKSLAGVLSSVAQASRSIRQVALPSERILLFVLSGLCPWGLLRGSTATCVGPGVCVAQRLCRGRSAPAAALTCQSSRTWRLCLLGHLPSSSLC